MSGGSAYSEQGLSIELYVGEPYQWLAASPLTSQTVYKPALGGIPFFLRYKEEVKEKKGNFSYPFLRNFV